MPHPRFKSEEIRRRGEELYDHVVRARVERDENIGKLVSMDIETGEYVIGDEDDLEAPRSLQAKHPGAAIYTRRIGYSAAYALGGVLERTPR